MKLPGKKAIVASVIAILAIPSAAYATVSYLNAPKAEPVQQAVVKEEVPAPAVEATVEPTPVEQTAPEPVAAPEPVVAPAPAPVQAPTVLSIQEYAEKWLDLSSYHAQLCLDRIVQFWPQRFTEDVRERNIKALRVWSNVCSTGADNDSVNTLLKVGSLTLEHTLIGNYGVNGEFFDSQLAKKHWND